MPKRVREKADDDFHSRKRSHNVSSELERPHSTRTSLFDRCSDEALLLILSHLSARDLTVCSRVCRKLNSLANDSIVWKNLFYRVFIEPRESRSQKRRDRRHSHPPDWFAKDAAYDSDVSWKSVYKLRHNWHKGRCSVDAINVSSGAGESAENCAELNENLVVRFEGRTIVTADSKYGLRIWDARGESVASSALPTQYSNVDYTGSYGDPSALWVDKSSVVLDYEALTILVGFTNGGFAIYTADFSSSEVLTLKYAQPSRAGGDPIISAAIEYPFLITLSSNKVVNIFQFEEQVETTRGEKASHTYEKTSLITSLRAQSVSGPTSLSMRKSTISEKVYATIAYTHPVLASRDWTVAVQEIELDPTSGMTRLRTANALSKTPASIYSSQLWTAHPDIYFTLSDPPTPNCSSSVPPTSLSYAHPFLLTSHADNTLVSYLVRSTDSELNITSGQRLWGHTKSVANVEVKERGKAVSISADAEEIRVWDLEPMHLGRLNRDSVQIRVSDNQDNLPKRIGNFFGFDDEKVVVEEDRESGKVVLLYDFT
ncbi:hypothetical protein BZA70DRAFT_187936 [Myxozyma melibiosi]|uniref:F-box domain-containing protein n=1 Tax=Myxozyma melibiosi TaxID=54550 RepID=A0ABR1F326_9ASCO